MIWKPLQDIPFQDLYFLELRSGIDNLTVFLKALGSDERILKIKFDQMVGYRVFDEDFLNWFEKESLGLFDDRDLIHYLICNTDNIIDVISTSHVTVEWVDSL
jgi:hypothetical protein